MCKAFGMDQITSIYDLKIGMKVFYAYALGECSTVACHTVKSLPYIGVNGFEFFDTIHNYDTWDFKDDLICTDVIIGCSYNSHKLYFTKDAAEAYCDNCKILGTNIPHNHIHY